MAGLLAPGSVRVTASDVALVRNMYQTHTLGWIAWIHPIVLRLIFSNVLVVAVITAAVWLIRARRVASRGWAAIGEAVFFLTLGVMGLGVSLGSNVIVLFFGGQALAGLNGGSLWRGLLTIPHAVLEFAAYAIPLSLVFAGLPHDRGVRRQVLLGSLVLGALLLVPAGMVEVYGSPIIRHWLHLQY